MNGVKIRLAWPHERQALEALQRQASLVSQTYRDALLTHPDAIDLPMAQLENGAVWVAEAADGIAGFCVVLMRSEREAELDGLFVQPALWRGGIGRSLALHAASVARAQGAAMLMVVANPEAEGFYGALGFTRVGTVLTRFGAALEMRLELA